ncbi:MAG: transcriptional regulator [Gemmatimonadales bacterium]|nr:MAG: transcriptional regulator [Gemmatimonadales bacterium]
MREPVPESASATNVLSDVVRRRREDLGLRQTEVADLAGCSPRFVHTLEHGKPTVRLDKVLDVLEVLGLDLMVGPGRGRIRKVTGSLPGSRSDGGS